MKERIPLGWAGIDIGKGHHWVCLIDDAGTTVWSTRVVNDEAAILDVMASVLARAEEVLWGVDRHHSLPQPRPSLVGWRPPRWPVCVEPWSGLRPICQDASREAEHIERGRYRT